MQPQLFFDFGPHFGIHLGVLFGVCLAKVAPRGARDPIWEDLGFILEGFWSLLDLLFEGLGHSESRFREHLGVISGLLGFFGRLVGTSFLNFIISTRFPFTCQERFLFLSFFSLFSLPTRLEIQWDFSYDFKSILERFGSHLGGHFGCFWGQNRDRKRYRRYVGVGSDFYKDLLTIWMTILE